MCFSEPTQLFNSFHPQDMQTPFIPALEQEYFRCSPAYMFTSLETFRCLIRITGGTFSFFLWLLTTFIPLRSICGPIQYTFTDCLFSRNKILNLRSTYFFVIDGRWTNYPRHLPTSPKDPSLTQSLNCIWFIEWIQDNRLQFANLTKDIKVGSDPPSNCQSLGSIET